MRASLRHPALLALFCKVFCGAKPCGVQPRKHASKPSTNNLKNTGRCEENRKWRQRKIWPTGYGRCSRCRHLASHKSVTKSPRADLFLTCVHLCRIVSSDLGEADPVSTIFCGVECQSPYGSTPQKTPQNKASCVSQTPCPTCHPKTPVFTQKSRVCS